MRAGTPGAGAARCSPLLAPSSLPPFPSFCYLDFFSCCVMSIIYAKRFAACCTSRASRRGRRSGKGGGPGSGERRVGAGRNPRPRRGWDPGPWGGLTQTSLTVGLESRSIGDPVLPFLQPRIGAVTPVTLLVVNCPSRRRTSSSSLSSSLGKEWERGHSGSAAQGLGSNGALVAHPRADQGPERSTFVEGWSPTHSQVREGVKRKTKFGVMEKNTPLFR